MFSFLNYMKKKSSILCYMLIIITVYILGLVLYEYPGIYEDTMVPASLGVKILYPNSQNPPFPLMHSGIIFTPNTHHGSYSAWLQIITMLIARGGHLLSFRISILTVAAACSCLVFFILFKVTENKVVALIAALVSASGVNLNIISRSQFDIMYIGALFEMFAIYQLFLAEKQKSEVRQVKKRIFVCSLLQGLAFYGYFSYLFLYPAVLVWIMYRLKGRERISAWILSVCSLFIGCSFYIFGYADAALTSFLGTGFRTVELLVILAVFIYSFFGIPVYVILKNNKNRSLKIIVMMAFMLLLLITGATILLGRNYIFGKIAQIVGSSIVNNKNSIYALFFIYTFRVLQGDRISQMTGGNMIPYAGIVFLALFSATFIILIIVRILSRKHAHKETMAGTFLDIVYLHIIVFYFFSLIMIRSMWAQHFTIMYFLIIIMTALLIYELILNCTAISVKKIVLVTTVISTVLLATNIYENTQFFRILMETGGVGGYSNQLTELCQEAYKRYTDGEKEIYVFAEWGFKEPFVYFTDNAVLYREQSIDEKETRYYLDKGYSIIYCSNDKNRIDGLLQESGITAAYTIDARLQKDGKPAFYMVKYKK